jgi:hypothetical protein
MNTIADIKRDLDAAKTPPDAPVMIALPEVWQQLADLMGEPERMHARFLELVASGQITYVVKHGDEE